MHIQVQKLTERQLQELKILAFECKEIDGNSIPFYAHLLTEERVLPSTFLYYEDHKLIGFLSAFFFYENACEVSLMIAPAKRKKGIARKLLRELLPLLDSEGIDSLIFSIVEGIDKSWLELHHFQYQNTEYEMQRNSTQPVRINRHSLRIRDANEADIPALCSIDFLCFPNQPLSLSTRLFQIVHDSNYSLIAAELGDALIGKAQIHWQEDKARLTDIGIIPTQQGKGLGTELMSYCINHAISSGKYNLLLDVETNNQNALRLYTNLGFSSTNSCDFWVISTQHLRQFT
jgi:ribosomal protein S18 acetylase RimI-like enzyme